MNISYLAFPNSLQGVCEVKNDFQESLMKRRLLERFLKGISGSTTVDEARNIAPNLKIKVIKIVRPSGRDIALGGLHAPGYDLRDTFGSRESMLDMPNVLSTLSIDPEDTDTQGYVERKLEGFVSDNGDFREDPLEWRDHKVTTFEKSPGNPPVILTEDLDEEDTDYAAADQMDEAELSKAVKMLALIDKHSDDPDPMAIKEDINRLTVNITNPDSKKLVQDYLLLYANDPSKGPMLRKESNLIIEVQKRKGKTKSGTPIWVIVTILAVVAAGAIAYTQRHKISLANQVSREAGISGNSRFRTFFKALFDKELQRENLNYRSNAVKSQRATSIADNLERQATDLRTKSSAFKGLADTSQSVLNKLITSKYK